MEFDQFEKEFGYGTNVQLLNGSNTDKKGSFDNIVEEIISDNQFNEKPPSPLRFKLKEDKEKVPEDNGKVTVSLSKSLLEKLKNKKKDTSIVDQPNRSNSITENANHQPSLSNTEPPKRSSISPQEEEPTIENTKHITKEISSENPQKSRKIEKAMSDVQSTNGTHTKTEEMKRENSLNGKDHSSNQNGKKKDSNEKLPIIRASSNNQNNEKKEPTRSSKSSSEKDDSSKKIKQEITKESQKEKTDTKSSIDKVKKEKIPLEKSSSDPRRSSTSNESYRRSSSSGKPTETKKYDSPTSNIRNSEERNTSSPKEKKRKRSDSPSKDSPKSRDEKYEQIKKEKKQIYNLVKRAQNMKHEADRVMDPKEKKIAYLRTGSKYLESYFRLEDLANMYRAIGNNEEYLKTKKESSDGFLSMAKYFKQNGEPVTQELKNLSESPSVDDNKKKELNTFATSFFQCIALCYSKVFHLQKSISSSKIKNMTKSLQNRSKALSDRATVQICDVFNEITPLLEMKENWSKAMSYQSSTLIENLLNPSFKDVSDFIEIQITRVSKSK